MLFFTNDGEFNHPHPLWKRGTELRRSHQGKGLAEQQRLEAQERGELGAIQSGGFSPPSSFQSVQPVRFYMPARLSLKIKSH